MDLKQLIKEVKKLKVRKAYMKSDIVLASIDFELKSIKQTVETLNYDFIISYHAQKEKDWKKLKTLLEIKD